MKHTLRLGTLVLALVTRMAAAAPAAPAGSAAEISGKVVETINAASYTYVLINTGAKQVWAAAPQFTVKAGDAVVMSETAPMPNYHSKTLNRTFDVVYFSGRAAVNGKPAGPAAELPAGHPPTGQSAGRPSIDLAGIMKAVNGQTVAEVHAGKAKLAGKTVVVRGRVVKFNANIMGKNWLHVRDGSGAEGSNDLTVTTGDKAKVGDVVLVTGKLSTDRDFGSGYKYSLIVEDAKVAVE